MVMRFLYVDFGGLELEPRWSSDVGNEGTVVICLNQMES